MSDLSREQQLVVAEKFLPALVQIARRHATCADDAEDAAQEAFLRLMEAKPHVRAALRTEAKVRKWLKTTAIRVCIDKHRGTARYRLLLTRLFAWALDVSDIADDVCSREEAAWLAGVVEGMPKKHRGVAEVFMAGGGIPEVQERFGVSYNAAEHMVRDTRTRLQRAVLASRIASVMCVFRVRRRGWGAVAALGTAAVIVGVLSGPIVEPIAPTPPANDATGFREATPLLAPAPARMKSPQATFVPITTPSPSAPKVTHTRHGDPPDSHRHSGRNDQGNTFAQDILWCVEHVEITPSHVGC
jgi:DNA-directed RNA polymerase specialized sigma24 family protein